MRDYAMNKPITKIVYHFQDASVPPQYHRSYTITVTRDHAHVIVDSYGDILADTSIDIAEQVIDDLARGIEIYQIKQQKRKSDTMEYTGGTSKSLTIYSDGIIMLDGTVYDYRGRLEGNLSGNIDAFTHKIEDLIPNFADLTKRF
jgi:hypothetical protein